MIVAMQDQATEKQVQDVIERMVELGFNVHRTTGANQTILAGVGTAARFDVLEFKVLLRRTRRLPHLLALQAGGAKIPAGGNQGRVRQRSRGRRQGSCGGWPGAARRNRASRSLWARNWRARRARSFCAAARPSRAVCLHISGNGDGGAEAAARSRRPVRADGDQRSDGDLEIERMVPFIDLFQVGARNMQNFNLLRELGHSARPCC